MTGIHSGGKKRPEWAPDDVDITRPSAARVYDYYLGGSHNFAADREVARQAMEAFPGIRLGAFANRAFLRRAVHFMLDRGVTQFLDIGSGIPTVGNVHEVAQGIDRGSRVVYVDVDPIAVTHSRAVLSNVPNTGVVHADIREPDHILTAFETNRILDLRRPVGLLMFAVVHFLSDSDDPAALVARYRDALAPGSYLALTHASSDEFPGRERFEAWKAMYDRGVTQTTTRSKKQIEALFDGFEMVEPGVVWTPDWHPDLEEPSHPTPMYCAVGRRR